VVVTKDSSAQDIVKAIVSQGQAAGLSEDQIKTVIATAKIESGFRPTGVRRRAALRRSGERLRNDPELWEQYLAERHEWDALA
jgi:hypothetical protein